MSEKTYDKKTNLFQRSLIFQALDEHTKAELADMAHMRHFKAGEVITAMGAPGDSMMAIAEGNVRISVSTPTGRDVILAELTTGEVFGEIALLDGGERSADAQAQTNCTLIVLERRSLLAVVNSRPDLALKLIEMLCARLRRSDERMMELAFLQLPARLAKALLRSTPLPSSGVRQQTLAKLSISQTEMANMVGSSRENVNRCLRKWQASGLVNLKDGWLIILDRGGLERLADEA